nr:unnamed protein product [Callosobruchus analis]
MCLAEEVPKDKYHGSSSSTLFSKSTSIHLAVSATWRKGTMFKLDMLGECPVSFRDDAATPLRAIYATYE